MSKYDFTTRRTLNDSPSNVRKQLEQFVHKAESGIPCIICASHSLGNFEATTHTFLLDRDDWWFSEAVIGFLNYLDSFSDDYLVHVLFVVFY